MKIKSIIKSTHDLKKGGYIILRKLHKLEKKSNLNSAYQLSCEEGFFVVLASKNLFTLIMDEYKDKIDIAVFEEKSDRFLAHLKDVAESNCRINRQLLSSYLSYYTDFFNSIIEKRIKFTASKELIDQWNQKCVMAHIAAWGER